MHKSPFLLSPFQTFYGGEKVGVNPKVNNMYPGYTAAKYELILVSDCRIRSKFQPLDADMQPCLFSLYIRVIDTSMMFLFLHSERRYPN